MQGSDATALVALLKNRGLTVSTAESCTGGLIASMIVDVPGASAVFPGGVVTYAESVKAALLGVPEEIIRTCGVVSREVAEAMATGARRRFGTDCAVSVTGVAGPDGGTKETPVGRVFIGVAVGEKTVAFREDLAGDRNAIRQAAAGAAIRRLYSCLTETD